MARVLRPFYGLRCRAETAPELVFYREMLVRAAESLKLYVCGLGTPSLTVWNAWAIDDISDSGSMRAEMWEVARGILAGLGLTKEQVGALRAFQIVWQERRFRVRFNHDVSGTLTARLRVNPDRPDKPVAQLEFGPAPDDQYASQYFVIQLKRDGRSTAIVNWDLVPEVIRHPPAEIRDMVLRSLPPGGARRRWKGLTKDCLSMQIPNAYFDEGMRQPDARTLATRLLEYLEQSERAGLPSRTSGLECIPLHDPEAPEGSPDSQEGQHLGLAFPAETVDAAVEREQETELLYRNIARLNPRWQTILARHLSGETEEQIASDLGISQQAVSKVLRKATDKLRNMISSKELRKGPS